MLILGILLIFPLVSALTLSPGTILNTSSSNSSMTFSFNVNVKNVTINPNSIFLYWVTYTENGENKFSPSINFSDPNSNKDSSQFGSPLTDYGGGWVGEGTEEVVPKSTIIPTEKEKTPLLIHIIPIIFLVLVLIFILVKIPKKNEVRKLHENKENE